MRPLFFLFLASACVGYAQSSSTYDVDRLNDFYDEFLCEEKNTTAEVDLTGSCAEISTTSGFAPPSPPTPTPTPTPPTPPTPTPPVPPKPTPPASPLSPQPVKTCLPVVISNKTGLASSRINVVMFGQSNGSSSQSLYHIVSLDSEGRMYLKPSPATTASFSPSFSFTLNELPRSTTNPTTDYLVYIQRQVDSGRIYFSIDTPLYLMVGNGTVRAPLTSAFNDPNFNTLFESIEFTLRARYHPVPGGVELAPFINTTEVDSFGLPLKIGFYSFSSANPSAVTPYINTNVGSNSINSTLPSGFEQSRSTILTDVVAALAAGDLTGAGVWSRLPLPFYSDPYTQTGLQTYLRIWSPNTSLTAERAQAAPGGGYSGAIPARFPSDYISNAAYSGGGLSFQEHFFNFYRGVAPSTGTLYMQSLVNSSQNYVSAPSGLFNIEFNSSLGTAMLALGNFTTTALFANTLTMPGTAPATDLTALPLMIEIAFMTGFMPTTSFFTSADPLSLNVVNPVTQALSALYKHIGPGGTPPLYFAGAYTTDFPTLGGGPWYDLYSKSVHAEAVSTSSAAATFLSGTGLCYGSPYDDALSISGVMSLPNTTPKSVNPYLIIDLGPVDTAVPTSFVFEDTTVYTVTFVSASSQTIQYRQGTSGSLTTVVQGAPYSLSSTSSNPVQILLSNGVAFAVFFKYQFLQPVGAYNATHNAVITDPLTYFTPSPAGAPTAFTLRLP